METAWDFTMFYVAAHAPIGSIHDQAVFRETARQALAGTAVQYASPYVRPAVFAFSLRWMRWFSYWKAYSIWAGLELIFYGATLLVLWRRFRVRVPGWYPWALFFPAFYGIITGQDALLMGLVLCLAVAVLADGRDAAGGALLSLTLYKFNLFLLLPIYLVLQKRYRALAVYAVCGGVLAIISVLLERPSLYLRLLSDIQRYTIGFSPETMLGLRGLSAALGFPAAYPIAALACSAYALAVSRRMDFVRGFGLMVTASVLCAYHAAWYDGAVLVLPFGLVLAASNRYLRILTTGLMVIPFWNVKPAFVTVLLVVFATLYSTASGWTRPKHHGSECSARPEKIYEN